MLTYKLYPHVDAYDLCQAAGVNYMDYKCYHDISYDGEVVWQNIHTLPSKFNDYDIDEDIREMLLKIYNKVVESFDVDCKGIYVHF